ncbi:MAG: hypothetical protein AYK22_05685 [Thermoplasmatales archaeon SG8-52-3]|nr:MAG: hypothetical protein AYK22_05685 [Thermoplasmatales archaeon SG8-52-3]
MDEKGRKIIVESIDIGIAILIIAIGFLLVFFSFSWFNWFIERSTGIEDWLSILKFIFVITGIIIVIYGIKKIFQDLIL